MRYQLAEPTSKGLWKTWASALAKRLLSHLASIQNLMWPFWCNNAGSVKLLGPSHRTARSLMKIADRRGRRTGHPLSWGQEAMLMRNQWSQSIRWSKAGSNLVTRSSIWQRVLLCYTPLASPDRQLCDTSSARCSIPCKRCQRLIWSKASEPHPGTHGCFWWGAGIDQGIDAAGSPECDASSVCNSSAASALQQEDPTEPAPRVYARDLHPALTQAVPQN